MKKYKGFTLTEVVCVLVVGGIVAAAAVPGINGYIKHSKAASCKANTDELKVDLKYAVNSKRFANCEEINNKIKKVIEEYSHSELVPVCNEYLKDNAKIDCSNLDGELKSHQAYNVSMCPNDNTFYVEWVITQDDNGEYHIDFICECDCNDNEANTAEELLSLDASIINISLETDEGIYISAADSIEEDLNIKIDNFMGGIHDIVRQPVDDSSSDGTDIPQVDNVITEEKKQKLESMLNSDNIEEDGILVGFTLDKDNNIEWICYQKDYDGIRYFITVREGGEPVIEYIDIQNNGKAANYVPPAEGSLGSTVYKNEWVKTTQTYGLRRMEIDTTKYVGNIIGGQISENKEIKWTQRDKDWYIESWQEYPIVEPDKSFICSKRKPVKAELSFDKETHKYNMVIHYDDESSIAIDMITANHIDIVDSESSESRRVWYLLNGYIISDENKTENWTYAFNDGSLEILENVVDKTEENLKNFEDLKINELYFLYQETYKFYEDGNKFNYTPITVDSKIKRTLVDSNILLEKDGFYPQGIFDITIHNGNESAPTIIEDNVKALIPFYDDAFKSGYYFTESSDLPDSPDSSETKKEKYDATEVKKIADRGTADFEVWYVESESSQPVSLGSVERVFDAGRIVYEDGGFVPKGDFHTVITKKNNNETETITNKPEECNLSYYDAILDEGYYFMSLDENDDYKYNAEEISELVKEGQVNFKAYYEIDEDVFEIGVVNSKIDSDIVYIDEEYRVQSMVVINLNDGKDAIKIPKEVEYFNPETEVGYYFEFTDDKGEKVTSQQINERFAGYTGKVEVYHQYDATKDPIYCGTIERVLDNAELVYGEDGKFAPMGDFHTEIHNYDDGELSTKYESQVQRELLEYYDEEVKEGYYFKHKFNNQLYTADTLNNIARSEPVDFEMYYAKSGEDKVIGTITSDVSSTLVEGAVKNEFAVNSEITVNYENKDNSENKGSYTFDYPVNYYDETGIGYYYKFDGSDAIIQPETLKARFELYTDKVNVYHKYSEYQEPIEVGMIKRELTDKSTELVYDESKKVFVPMGSFYTSIENYTPEGNDIQMCVGQPEKRELQYLNESNEGYYFVDAQNNKYNAEDASRLIHSRSAKFEVWYKDAYIDTKVGSTQSVIASEIVRGEDKTYPVVSKITIDYTSGGEESNFVIDNTPVYYDNTADNYYYYKWSDVNGDIITIDEFEDKFANYTGKVDVYHQYAKDEEPLTVGTVERKFKDGTIEYKDGKFIPKGNFHTDIQNAKTEVDTGTSEEFVLEYYKEEIGEGYYFESSNSNDKKKYTAEEVSELAKNKPVNFNAYYAVAGKEEPVSIGAVVSTARASVAYDNTTDKYTVTAIFTIKYPNGEDVVSKVVEEYNEANKEGYYFEFTDDKGTKSTQEQLNNRFEGFTGKAEIYYQCEDGKTVVKAGEVERVLESTELTYENEVFVPKGTFHTEVRSLDGSQTLETIYTSTSENDVLSYYNEALDEGYYFEDASGNKYTAETVTALIKSEPSSFGVHYKDGENIIDIGNVESSISSAIVRGENHTYPVTSTITVKYSENSFTINNTPVYYDETSKNYYYYKWSDTNGDMITVGEFTDRFANYTGKVDVYHQYAEGKEPLAVGTVERIFENGTIKYADGKFVPVGNFRTDIQNAELEVNTGTSEECVLKYYNETIGEGYYFTKADNSGDTKKYTAEEVSELAKSGPVSFNAYYAVAGKDQPVSIGSVVSTVKASVAYDNTTDKYTVTATVTLKSPDNSIDITEEVGVYDANTGKGYYFEFTDDKGTKSTQEQLNNRFEGFTGKAEIYYQCEDGKTVVKAGEVERVLESTELAYENEVFVPKGTFHTEVRSLDGSQSLETIYTSTSESDVLSYYNESLDEGYYFEDASGNKYTAETATALIKSEPSSFGVHYKDGNVIKDIGNVESSISSAIERGENHTYPVTSTITVKYGENSFTVDNTPVYYDGTSKNYYYYKWSDSNGDMITVGEFADRFANYTGKVDVYHQYAEGKEPLAVGTVERIFENGTIKYTDGQFVPVGNFRTDIKNAESEVNTGTSEECVLNYYNEEIGEGYYFTKADNSGDTTKYTAEQVSELAKNGPVNFKAYYAVAEETYELGVVHSEVKASVAYDAETDKYTVTATVTLKSPDNSIDITEEVGVYDANTGKGYYFEFTDDKGTKSTQEQLNNRFEGFTGKAEIYYQCEDGKTVVKAGEVERVLESTELTYENEVFVPKGTFHTEVRSLDGSQSLKTIYTSEGKECVLSYYDESLDEGYYFEDASGNKYTAETATALIKSEPSSFEVHYKDGENIADIGNVESSISSAIERGENHTYPVTSTITVKYGENSFTVDNTPVYYDGTSKNYYYYKWSDTNGNMITVGEFAERFANYTGKVDVYHQYAEGKEPLAVGTVERIFENGTIKYADGKFVPVGNFHTDIQNAELEVDTGASEECVLKYYNETIGEGYYFTNAVSNDTKKYTAEEVSELAKSGPVNFNAYYAVAEETYELGVVHSEVRASVTYDAETDKYTVTATVTLKSPDNSVNITEEVGVYDASTGKGYYFEFTDDKGTKSTQEQLNNRFEGFTGKAEIYYQCGDGKTVVKAGEVERILESTELTYENEVFVPKGTFHTEVRSLDGSQSLKTIYTSEGKECVLSYYDETLDEGYYFEDASDNKYTAETATALIKSEPSSFEVHYKDGENIIDIGNVESSISSAIVRGENHTYPVTSTITVKYGENSFTVDNTPVYYDETSKNYYYYKWSDSNGEIVPINEFADRFANYTGKVDVYHQYAEGKEPLAVGTVERIFANGTIKYADGKFVPVGNFHTDIQNAELEVNTGASEECVLKYYNETIGEGYYFTNADNSGDTTKYTAEQVSELAKSGPVNFKAYYAVAEETYELGVVHSEVKASVAYDNTTDKYTVTATVTLKSPDNSIDITEEVGVYDANTGKGYYFEFTDDKGTKSTQEQLNSRFEGFTGKAEIYYQCEDGKTVVKAGEVERILESTELTYENEVFVPKGTFHTEVRSLDDSQTLKTIYTSEGKECVLSYYNEALDEGYYFEDASGNKYTAETATALIKSEPSIFEVHYKDGENIADIGNVESSISSAIERGENHTYPVTSTITVKYGENSFTVNNTPVYYDGTSKNYYYYKWSDTNGDMITVGEFADRFANYTGKVDVYHQYAEGKEPLAVGTVERIFANGTIRYTDGQFVPVGNFRTDIQNAELEVNTGASEECVLKYYNETIGEGYYFTKADNSGDTKKYTAEEVSELAKSGPVSFNAYYAVAGKDQPVSIGAVVSTVKASVAYDAKTDDYTVTATITINAPGVTDVVSREVEEYNEATQEGYYFEFTDNKGTKSTKEQLNERFEGFTGKAEIYYQYESGKSPIKAGEVERILESTELAYENDLFVPKGTFHTEVRSLDENQTLKTIYTSASENKALSYYDATINKGYYFTATAGSMYNSKDATGIIKSEPASFVVWYREGNTDSKVGDIASVISSEIVRGNNNTYPVNSNFTVNYSDRNGKRELAITSKPEYYNESSKKGYYYEWTNATGNKITQQSLAERFAKYTGKVNVYHKHTEDQEALAVGTVERIFTGGILEYIDGQFVPKGNFHTDIINFNGKTDIGTNETSVLEYFNETLGEGYYFTNLDGNDTKKYTAQEVSNLAKNVSVNFKAYYEVNGKTVELGEVNSAIRATVVRGSSKHEYPVVSQIIAECISNGKSEKYTYDQAINYYNESTKTGYYYEISSQPGKRISPDEIKTKFASYTGKIDVYYQYEATKSPVKVGVVEQVLADTDIVHENGQYVPKGTFRDDISNYDESGVLTVTDRGTSETRNLVYYNSEIGEGYYFTNNEDASQKKYTSEQICESVNNGISDYELYYVQSGTSRKIGAVNSEMKTGIKAVSNGNNNYNYSVTANTVVSYGKTGTENRHSWENAISEYSRISDTGYYFEDANDRGYRLPQNEINDKLNNGAVTINAYYKYNSEAEPIYCGSLNCVLGEMTAIFNNGNSKTTDVFHPNSHIVTTADYSVSINDVNYGNTSLYDYSKNIRHNSMCDYGENGYFLSANSGDFSDDYDWLCDVQDNGYTGDMYVNYNDNGNQRTVKLYVEIVVEKELSDDDIKNSKMTDFVYLKNDDDTVYIYGYVGNDTDIVIPSQVKGYWEKADGWFDNGLLAEIGGELYKYNKTSIGDGVWFKPKTYEVVGVGNPKAQSQSDNIKFGNKLWKPVLSSKQETIRGCTPGNIKSITFSRGIEHIYDYAFAGIDNINAEINLSKGITTIGKEAFKGGRNFKGNLTIPETVTSIGADAFDSFAEGASEKGTLRIYGCSGTETITKSDGTSETVKVIGPGLFDIAGFKNVIIGKNVEKISDYAFGSNNHNLFGSLRIESPVKYIGNYAFQNCVNMEGQLIISDTVRTIGDGAFYNCESFKSMHLPVGVEYIGNSAFDNCNDLQGDLVIPETVTYLGTNAFRNYSDNRDVNTVGDLIIRGGTKDENGNITINKGVFTQTRFMNVTVGGNVTHIGEGAFENSDHYFGDVIIEDSVKSIGARAFQRCSKMNSLIIPESVTYIGQGAFEGFASNNNPPRGSLQIYGGNREGEDIVINSGVFNQSRFKDVIIGGKVTKIADNAFSQIYENFIGSLTIKSPVNYIGNSAFRDCRGFYGKLTIPESVKTIGSSAFAGCNNFSEFELNYGADTSIDQDAFQNLRIPN